MTFTLMLILNIVLDVLVVAGLAFVMSRPARLRPHGGDVAARAPSRRRSEQEPARARGERVGSPLRPQLD